MLNFLCLLFKTHCYGVLFGSVFQKLGKFLQTFMYLLLITCNIWALCAFFFPPDRTDWSKISKVSPGRQGTWIPVHHSQHSLFTSGHDRIWVSPFIEKDVYIIHKLPYIPQVTTHRFPSFQSLGFYNCADCSYRHTFGNKGQTWNLIVNCVRTRICGETHAIIVLWRGHGIINFTWVGILFYQIAIMES